jgi:putative transposase
LTADLPADDVEQVAAVIAHRCTSRPWISIRDQAGLSTDQGRRAVMWPPHALAESFNAAVKVERVNRTVYPTRKKARDDVARYIEVRYNWQRLHSALGYRIPQEVLDEHLNTQAAA